MTREEHIARAMLLGMYYIDHPGNYYVKSPGYSGSDNDRLDADTLKPITFKEAMDRTEIDGDPRD